eukprot:18992-Heterococcus_DN1.PRE.2
MGKVLKGGTPDRTSAARKVLKDWNSGKVPYYTVPPSEDDASVRKQTSGVQIMNGFSPEFDPLALKQHDNEVMNSLPERDTAEMFLSLKSTGMSNGQSGANTADSDSMMQDGNDDDNNSSDNDNDDDDSNNATALMPSKQKTSAVAAVANDEDAMDDDDDDEAEAIAPTAAKVTRTKALAPSHQLEAVLAEEQRLNPRLGNDRKKRAKAEKKQTRRQQTRAAKEALNTATAAYDTTIAASSSKDLSDDDDL